jgi:hypothetical protein
MRRPTLPPGICTCPRRLLTRSRFALGRHRPLGGASAHVWERADHSSWRCVRLPPQAQRRCRRRSADWDHLLRIPAQPGHAKRLQSARWRAARQAGGLLAGATARPPPRCRENGTGCSGLFLVRNRVTIGPCSSYHGVLGASSAVARRRGAYLCAWSSPRRKLASGSASRRAQHPCAHGWYEGKRRRGTRLSLGRRQGRYRRAYDGCDS